MGIFIIHSFRKNLRNIHSQATNISNIHIPYKLSQIYIFDSKNNRTQGYHETLGYAHFKYTSITP